MNNYYTSSPDSCVGSGLPKQNSALNFLRTDFLFGNRDKIDWVVMFALKLEFYVCSTVKELKVVFKGIFLF